MNQTFKTICKYQKHLKSGFTLVEVMLVIIVIGILSTVISFNGSFAVDKASKTATEVDMGVYEIAISDVNYSNEITNIDELSGYLNSNIEGQFRVKKVGTHLESVSRTNKNGESYEIHTTDFKTYTLKCGKVQKVIEVNT